MDPFPPDTSLTLSSRILLAFTIRNISSPQTSLAESIASFINLLT